MIHSFIDTLCVPVKEVKMPKRRLNKFDILVFQDELQLGRATVVPLRDRTDVHVDIIHGGFVTTQVEIVLAAAMFTLTEDPILKAALHVYLDRRGLRSPAYSSEEKADPDADPFPF
jgi:hypothetical protein